MMSNRTPQCLYQVASAILQGRKSLLERGQVRSARQALRVHLCGFGGDQRCRHRISPPSGAARALMSKNYDRALVLQLSLVALNASSITCNVHVPQQSRRAGLSFAMPLPCQLCECTSWCLASPHLRINNQWQLLCSWHHVGAHTTCSGITQGLLQQSANHGSLSASLPHLCKPVECRRVLRRGAAVALQNGFEQVGLACVCRR
jgi:hypothetical protein